MRPTFPTYIIKAHAKKSMRGRFWKVCGITLLPTVIIFAVILAVIMLTPGAADSFKLIISGSFESPEARLRYANEVFDNLFYGAEAVVILFSFLQIGSTKTVLNMIRGKDVKVRDIFCYYNKWYIALIYPLVVSGVSIGLNSLLELAVSYGMDEIMVGGIGGIFELVILFISCRLIFFDYALADGGCKNVWEAACKAWNMTGVNTVVNAIILGVSFIGWFIVGALTGGILMIYVLPYVTLSMAVLYDANCEYMKSKEANSEN